MSELKPISEEELLDFVRIVADAFPAFNLTSEKEQREAVEQLARIFDDDRRQLIGLYREEELLGGMILHDFEMNVHGARLETGGVGLVAVHFLHKKEKVAKELITFFLEHFRERGATLALLYPFRPDFYGKMGFGFGPKLSEYKFLPAALPRGDTKQHVAYVDESEIEDLLACYNLFVQENHGMVYRRNLDMKRALVRPGYKIAAHRSGERLDGYLVFSLEEANAHTRTDLIVQELVYNSRQALSELLTFLHSQLDQVRRVVLRTHDDEFHHLLVDPRNDSGRLIPQVYHETSVQAVGLMYRVINCSALFEQLAAHEFGRQKCVVAFDVEDSFLQANNGTFLVSFDDGRAAVTPGVDPDVNVRLEISHFSALVMGTASFQKQYDYGQVEISDPSYVDVIDDLFHITHQPVCMTYF